jgi:hypothetical protein
MDRRNFIKTVTLACVAVQLPTASAQSAEPIITDDLLTCVSTGYAFLPHEHTISLDLAYLENPPAEGVTLGTTWALLHSHSVYITQEQLFAIGRGETITVVDSTLGEHEFAIYLPQEYLAE